VFLGFQRDVAAVLTALDIVVFPSLWEGTPLTAFEALAAGKPIVATDADGLLDILTDRKDALIVPKRDAGALARGVTDLIEQPELASRLAMEARRTGARYDISAFVRKMERLYEILHETSRATRRAGVLQADLGFLTADR
jgi:glycosyltransferase involved in cell wall biosynthesis